VGDFNWIESLALSVGLLRELTRLPITRVPARKIVGGLTQYHRDSKQKA